MYPRVTSEELDTEPDMEEIGATGGNHSLTEFQIIRQKMEQIQVQVEILWKSYK